MGDPVTLWLVVEQEGTPLNDLDVRLRWPDSDRAEAAHSPTTGPDAETDDAPTQDPVPTPAQAVMEPALAPLAARVDGLMAAVESLRSLVTNNAREAGRRHEASRQLLEDLGARLGALETAAMEPPRGASVHDTAVATALERLEQAVGDLTSNLVEQASVAERLVELEETVSRLEASRTQDLEQLLEAIDEAGRREIAVPEELQRALSAKGGADTRQARETKQSLKRLEERLTVMEELLQESQIGGEGDQDLGPHLEQIYDELERLRRRITLRGRSEPPLDDEALETLAVLIAERLAAPARAQQPSGRRRG